jgi:rhodanese-related sulfurtransferase
MGEGAGPRVTEVGPRDAWDILSSDEGAMLVDVRSEAEWSFVGLADLSSLGKACAQVEWARFPGMDPNPAFVSELVDRMGGLPPRLLFICRSGARSMQAARAVAASPSAGDVAECINVAEGFEGDLDAARHRGGHNGWKARGLAWRQT